MKTVKSQRDFDKTRINDFLDSSRKSSDQMIETYINILSNISYDSDVQHFMLDYLKSEQTNQKNIRNIIDKSAALSTSFISVCLIDKKGVNLANSSFMVVSAIEYIDCLEKADSNNIFFYTEEKGFFCIIQAIICTDISNTNYSEIIGYAYAKLRGDEILNVLSSVYFTQNTSVSFLFQDELLLETLPQNKASQRYSTICNFGFKIEIAIPKSEHLAIERSILLANGGLILFTLLISGGVVIIISSIFAKSLEKQKMATDILFSQINSHFLYNTLSNIRGMALKQGSSNIADSLHMLVRYFRYSANLQTFTTLEQELDSLKIYFQIQKLRFGENLNYKIECDENLLSCKILRMILQPIVENSIIHGFVKMKKENCIWIKIALQNKMLTIDVSDNGKGIEQKILDEINFGSMQKSENGIGLENLKRRLKMHYINSTLEVYCDEKTHINIAIPFEKYD